MTDSPSNAPAGWYPDANAPGGQRWWDGTRWTEHVGQPQPYQAAGPAMAPEGTRTGTVWIWLIVLTPLLSLASLFVIDWAAYVDSVATTSAYSGTASSLAFYTSPGYLISTLLGWLLYGLTVAFAALDVRELKRRGVPQPFHWAFAFLTNLVYVIGRSAVVKRRTGGGLAPLWVYIGVAVISFVAVIVLVVLIVQYMVAVYPVI